jgi:hypothetical protein
VAGAARLSQQSSAAPALVGLQEDGTFVAEVGGRAERGIVRLIAVGGYVVRASLKGLSFVAAKVFLHEAVEEGVEACRLGGADGAAGEGAGRPSPPAPGRPGGQGSGPATAAQDPEELHLYEFSYMGRIASVSAGLKADLSAAEPDTVTSLLDLFTELTSQAAEVGAGVEYTVEKDADRYTLKFSYSVRMPEKRAL